MDNKVLVETSARHVHVTAEQVEILFGKGAKLTKKKDLSQPGQFASEQRVTVVGPRNSIPNVVILGPERPAAQVEVSMTIVAKRHIHMTPEDAERIGVENGQIVSVKVNTPERSLIFGDVVVRVSPKFSLAMHIDTDESNAANAGGEVYGEIII